MFGSVFDCVGRLSMTWEICGENGFVARLHHYLSICFRNDWLHACRSYVCLTNCASRYFRIHHIIAWFLIQKKKKKEEWSSSVDRSRVRLQLLSLLCVICDYDWYVNAFQWWKLYNRNKVVCEAKVVENNKINNSTD